MLLDYIMENIKPFINNNLNKIINELSLNLTMISKSIKSLDKLKMRKQQSRYNIL